MASLVPGQLSKRPAERGERGRARQRIENVLSTANALSRAAARPLAHAVLQAGADMRAIPLLIAAIPTCAALACSNGPRYCEPGMFMPPTVAAPHCEVLADTMDEPAGDAGADRDGAE